MTNNPQADALIRTVVETYTDLFPNRIRTVYLIGSYADGTAVALSDIDLIVIFQEQFHDDAEKERAEAVAEECASNGPIRLDITPRGENEIETMYPVIRVGLKNASVLMYGQDIRDQMKLPSIEAYTQDVIEGALFFIARLHDLERITALPLDYTDSCDEFFGYARKRFVEWYPPDVQEGTKEFVATVSRIATATVAQRTGKYVGSKSEAVRLYGELMGEPWGPFVATVMQHCKHDWGYLIPETDFERLELAELCRQMRRFENDFCATVSIHPSQPQ